MNRTPLALAGSLLLAIALTGCGSTIAERGTAGASAAPSPGATTPAAPTQSVRIWGGFAVSIPYGSFAEWARDAARGGGGVALVRIMDVSGVRWSTASGEGPSEVDIARYNRGEVEFTIGRLVTVERLRTLRGTWPAAAGTTALYWLPGGQIGLDRTLTFEGDARGNEPQPGALAVASMFVGTDIDGADGVLFVTVQQLFPADASGRVRTFNPDETIMIGDIERYLPAP